MKRSPSDGIIFDFEYVKNEERESLLRRNSDDCELHRKIKEETVATEVITPLFGLSQMNADRFFEGKFPYVSDFLSGGAVWHYIFKCSILHDNALFFRPDMRMGEDSMFILRYLCYVKEINIINAKLYYYYERPSGALERIKRTPRLLFDCKMQLAEERCRINELCIQKYGRDLSHCYDASLLFSALELCIKLSRERYFGNIGLFLRYTSYPPVKQAIRRINLAKAPMKYKMPIRILQMGFSSLLYSIIYLVQRLGYKVSV
ncbi:MAG: hypothetical protein NC116_04365 [Clostridium sp.]|nr:hypothetical protein [Clostridium sp.]